MANDDILILMREDLQEVKSAIADMAKAVRDLAVLETKHMELKSAVARAFNDIEDHESRLRSIEVVMPTVKLSSGWMFKAVLGVMCLLGTVAASIIIERL